jgi:hypothetical protein
MWPVTTISWTIGPTSLATRPITGARVAARPAHAKQCDKLSLRTLLEIGLKQQIMVTGTQPKSSSTLHWNGVYFASDWESTHGTPRAIRKWNGLSAQAGLNHEGTYASTTSRSAVLPKAENQCCDVRIGQITFYTMRRQCIYTFFGSMLQEQCNILILFFLD